MPGRNSNLMAELKEKELQHYKNMSPEQRLKTAIAHSEFIKELCFAGLTKKGFRKEEINRIYHGQIDE